MANRMIDSNPKVIYQDTLLDEASNQLPVASTATVYGKAFMPPKNSSFGLILKFGSSGAVDVKVEVECGILPPTTENAADAAWAVGDTVSSGITDTVSHALVASPVVAPYCRFKFTGQGANAASTYVSNAKFTFAKNQ